MPDALSSNRFVLQIKSDSGDREEQKRILSSTEQAYCEIPPTVPGENENVQRELERLHAQPGQLQRVVYTQYHPVAKDESLALNVKW